MKKIFDRRFNKYVYEVFAGDYFATREQDVVLTTLLGSCISVCMRDKVTGIVGINHFMLPSSIRMNEIVFSEDAKYGINAMEKMINSMMKLGARRKSMEAKVFGGGRVMDTSLNNVAQSNIDFAFTYLEMEQIPVLTKDVGGQNGRKLLFFPEEFTIYLKRIRYKKTLEEAVLQEKRFLKTVQKHGQKESELTLFE